jgi:hypothetical protein
MTTIKTWRLTEQGNIEIWNYDASEIEMDNIEPDEVIESDYGIFDFLDKLGLHTENVKVLDWGTY